MIVCIVFTKKGVVSWLQWNLTVILFLLHLFFQSAQPGNIPLVNNNRCYTIAVLHHTLTVYDDGGCPAECVVATDTFVLFSSSGLPFPVCPSNRICLTTALTDWVLDLCRLNYYRQSSLLGVWRKKEKKKKCIARFKMCSKYSDRELHVWWCSVKHLHDHETARDFWCS